MERISGAAPRALLLAALVLMPLGCKKDPAAVKIHTPPPPPAGVKDSVEGRVEHHGVGLASGFVQFYGESGDPVTGTVMMGGTYTVWNPPRGRVKIAIVTTPPKDVSKAPPVERAGNVLPPRYADPDTSGLTFQVTGGKQVFNIALED